MFDSIKMYLIALLLIATIGLGWTTYNLVGKLAVAEEQIGQWQDTANKNAEATRIAGESCAISVKSIYETQRAIDALNESRGSDLEALATIPQTTLPETQVNATTTSTAAPAKNADDARLSPDVMRLLDNAYCSGDKDSAYCAAR